MRKVAASLLLFAALSVAWGCSSSNNKKPTAPPTAPPAVSTVARTATVAPSRTPAPATAAPTRTVTPAVAARTSTPAAATRTSTPGAAARTATPAAQAGDQARLQKGLLTLQDLPAGWSAEPSSSDGSEDNSTFCNSPGLPKTSIARAEIDFKKSDVGPFLNEQLALFPKDQGKATMDKGLAILKDCNEFTTTTSDGTMITLKLAPLSFPQLGEQSAAYRLSGTVSGVPLDGNLVFERRGDIIATLLHLAAFSPADSKDTETFARKADARLSEITK